MAIDVKRRIRQTSRDLRRWGERIERLDFLITIFAFCWLLARFFIFMLRRFRW